MPAAYSIVVRCHRDEVKDHKRKLASLGLHLENGSFYGCVRYRKYKKVKRYCEVHSLLLKMDTGYLARSGNYRTMFFKYHEPQIGNKYICSYCGRLLTKDKVTVDHLYPVKRVREEPGLQKKLRKMGIHDVNDPRNLVPSCSKCNAKKAAKMGRWIFYGKIGQSTILWIIRKILRLTLFIFAVYFLYSNGVLESVFDALRSDLFAPLYEQVCIGP